MALLFTILLISIFGFLFFYEFFMKGKRKTRGRKRIVQSPDFVPTSRDPSNKVTEIKSAFSKSASANPKWTDWKYRIWVELHRKSLLTVEDAVKVSGVSQKRVEKYLDRLEAVGRIQPAGDSARGIFYKVMES